VVADQLHNGNRHLTLRSGDGSFYLVPAWMVDSEAASIKIVDLPCLPVARLLELRAFLDSGLASDVGEQIPEGGVDVEALGELAAGLVREAATSEGARASRASEGVAAAPSAPDGGDGDLGEPVGGER
jgi:hypothetical protein